MSRIHIRFGVPCNEWAMEMVEKIAINHEVTMEKATLLMLETLIKSLSAKTDHQSSFDITFGLLFDVPVHTPKVLAQQYVESGVKHPMIVLAKDYVVHRVTGNQLALNEKHLISFGQDFEVNFGLEYLGHQRVER